jgi:hypothetical protein
MASKPGENWQSIDRTPGARLKPPADLPAPARKHFIDLVASMPTGHFMPGDIPLMKVWATTAVLCEEAARNMLLSSGLDTGKAADVHNRLTKTLLMLSRALLLGPTARRRRQSKKEQVPISGYDQMVLEGLLDE